MMFAVSFTLATIFAGALAVLFFRPVAAELERIRLKKLAWEVFGVQRNLRASHIALGPSGMSIGYTVDVLTEDQAIARGILPPHPAPSRFRSVGFSADRVIIDDPDCPHERREARFDLGRFDPDAHGPRASLEDRKIDVLRCLDCERELDDDQRFAICKAEGHLGKDGLDSGGFCARCGLFIMRTKALSPEEAEYLGRQLEEIKRNAPVRMRIVDAEDQTPLAIQIDPGERVKVSRREDGAYTAGPPPDGRSVNEHLDELIARPLPWMTASGVTLEEMEDLAADGKYAEICERVGHALTPNAVRCFRCSKRREEIDPATITSPEINADICHQMDIRDSVRMRESLLAQAKDPEFRRALKAEVECEIARRKAAGTWTGKP